MARIRTLLSLSVLLLYASALPALANDSSLNPGAHGPEPLDIRDGRESLIRMVEEELTFHFGKWHTRVHARFVFENTSADSTVRQLSGFPDDSVEGVYPEVQPYRLHDWEVEEFDRRQLHSSPIADMKTRIDGKPVVSSLRFGFVTSTDEAPWGWVAADTVTGVRVRWYVVELVIPPKSRVTLERSYRARNGHQGMVGSHFQYLTLTGGPWHGTIGRLTAHVILEDGLTVDNLVWDEGEYDPWSLVTYPPREEWRVEGRKRLSLIWTDFDPRLDVRKHQLGLAWFSMEPEDARAWRGERFRSRWWPWHWFE